MSCSKLLAQYKMKIKTMERYQYISIRIASFFFFLTNVKTSNASKDVGKLDANALLRKCEMA